MPTVPAQVPEQPIRIPIPSELRAEPLVLRPWSRDHAAALHGALLDNVEHLRPWMAWAADEPRQIEERVALIDGWVEAMESGRELQCSLWLGERLAGSAGLMQRRGPRALVIGYWVDRRLTGRKVATTAAYLLTELAAATEGVERVQIWHDRANLTSRRVPEHLGYRLVRELRSERPGQRCPGEDGVDCVWEMSTIDWVAGRDLRPVPQLGLPRS
ncbi:MAG TPA: GNAT family N-acetyltransferase [Acidimicrobiales bacterium]|nr:GNAT family N-acetyltransferase [Acidimicrobiales bacterium]